MPVYCIAKTFHTVMMMNMCWFGSGICHCSFSTACEYHDCVTVLVLLKYIVMLSQSTAAVIPSSYWNDNNNDDHLHFNSGKSNLKQVPGFTVSN